MENLPQYISIVFCLTTFLTIAIFYKASHYSKPTLVILLIWLTIQTIVGLSGFYIITDTTPPRFLLLPLPPLVFIMGLFATKKGRKYIDGLDLKYVTLLHIIRIPVELVLLWLFVHKTLPQLVTFEGRNYDILSGLTAPIIFHFGFIKNSLSKKIILIWTFICLGLLLNIVANMVLSAPFPFQKFAFDQPAIAILYFPFIWLPSCIVPLVLFSHLTSIRLLFIASKK